MAQIWLKRAYDEPSDQDGTRVLVDGMWPRGVKKENADIDLWLKDIAPSKDLRQWFGHDPRRWEAFERRYFEELESRREPVQQLQKYVQQGRVTLVYSAKDEQHNNAVALKRYLTS